MIGEYDFKLGPRDYFLPGYLLRFSAKGAHKISQQVYICIFHGKQFSRHYHKYGSLYPSFSFRAGKKALRLNRQILHRARWTVGAKELLPCPLRICELKTNKNKQKQKLLCFLGCHIHTTYPCLSCTFRIPCTYCIFCILCTFCVFGWLRATKPPSLQDICVFYLPTLSKTMVIMITMIMSIMIMTDNDDDDDDDHVHPMILNIRFCRLPIVLHKIFCVYSVYILCFLVGCEREFLHPRQLRTKTESAPPST